MNRPFVWAIWAMAAALLWMAASTAFARGGSVAGLFYTGEFAPIPPELGGERIWRAPGERGYDGQFYHLIAHDPLLRRGFERYIDNVPLRWRRILVPALAWATGGGQDALIDFGFVAVQLAFTFLGAWWLSRLARRAGRDVRWGLAFLLIPAVLVSIDRMTVDLALAALTIGLVLYESERRRVAVWWILALAPLVRETGVVLAAGYMLYAVMHRRIKDGFLAALCLLPALGWFVWVALHTVADRTPWLAAWPFAGLIERTMHGVAIPRTTFWMQLAGATERLALTGLWAAVLMAAFIAWRRRRELPALMAVVFTLFAAALGKGDIWADAYAAGRTMSPLLISLALIGLAERKWWFMAPTACVLPRIALQYEATVREMLRGIL